MRPSREAFEEALAVFCGDYAEYRISVTNGSSRYYVDETVAEATKSKAVVMGAYDQQEATIRELSEALEAVLDNVPACVFVDTYPWEGRCGIHDFTIQKPRECAVQHAVEVLARTRGAS